MLPQGWVNLCMNFLNGARMELTYSIPLVKAKHDITRPFQLGLGCPEGKQVGFPVGWLDGFLDGCIVGCPDGTPVG